MFSAWNTVLHTVHTAALLSQNRRNRNDSLLMILPLIMINRREYPALDAAQFPAANSRFKQHGQNSRIAYLHEIAAFAGTKHLAHICNRKRQNHGFVLFAPLKFCACWSRRSLPHSNTEWMPLPPSKVHWCSCPFPSLTHKSWELPHDGKWHVFNLRNSCLLFTKAQKRLRLFR